MSKALLLFSGGLVSLAGLAALFSMAFGDAEDTPSPSPTPTIPPPSPDWATRPSNRAARLQTDAERAPGAEQRWSDADKLAAVDACVRLPELLDRIRACGFQPRIAFTWRALATQDAAEGERLILEGQLSEVNRRLDNLYEAVESGSIPASRLAPRIEQVSRDKETLEAKLAALPDPGSEPLLLIDDADIEAWVADLRAVVERGTVDERRALLRAWVKRVVANGDDLTVEYTFPLVNVPGPAGGPGGGQRGPATRTAVYDRRRRTIRKRGPKLRKGEPAVRRVLPTVVDGSPGWTSRGTWVLEAQYPRGAPVQRRRGTGAGEVAPAPAPKETGLERWARWAAMVEGGMTKAEVARAEGVSRAAVTQGLRKLARR